MLTQCFKGEENFPFHGEGSLPLGGLSAICYEEWGICSAAMLCLLASIVVQLVLPGHGCLVWYLPGY